MTSGNTTGGTTHPSQTIPSGEPARKSKPARGSEPAIDREERSDESTSAIAADQEGQGATRQVQQHTRRKQYEAEKECKTKNISISIINKGCQVSNEQHTKWSQKTKQKETQANRGTTEEH